jgi:hypothetical protein
MISFLQGYSSEMHPSILECVEYVPGFKNKQLQQLKGLFEPKFEIGFERLILLLSACSWSSVSALQLLTTCHE